MHNDRNLSVFGTILLGTSMILINQTASASEGASDFQQNCTRCHRSAAQFKTPPEQIDSLLKSGSIRQHRFNLDEKTIQDIIAYIKQQKS